MNQSNPSVKKELLATLQSEITNLKIFNHTDLFEKITYEESDLPVCIIKDLNDSISIPSSGNWKIQSNLEIAILHTDGLESIDLTNQILKFIGILPQHRFIYVVEEINKEAGYLDFSFFKTSINLQVSYFNLNWEL
ncbi:hypothetical protein BKH41_03820 [Helicobacter sp. 12S02232-10]|uniref:hypothetical protein n=1 Tax=Helicobacter sp. 12S02232-10 TaxID=1476197 RepID=UPI000BA6A467|nr:hypothetical protein [Helicobacter sp. 12S02232-10]PAF49218.1 hypothetical protein BKH41_03820 [Helicobacter sp. 12S02232-10]